MSTGDTSFNATGPTSVGFETSSTDIPVNAAFGVSVVASKCGVYGQGTIHDQLDRRKSPLGTGVMGRGEMHGVYGITSDVTVDATPDFNSPDVTSRTSPTPPEPMGVVGVNGRTRFAQDAPAIYGDNNILTSDTIGTDNLSSAVKKTVTEGIEVAVGVEGMSYHGYGILGVSLNLSPGKDRDFPKIGGSDVLPEVADATRGVIHDVIDPYPLVQEEVSDKPGGVLGLSLQGYGVRGVSRLERGGVFQSATARYRYDGTNPPVIAGPMVAQIRLVPHRAVEVDPQQKPRLPFDGQTGDLLAVVADTGNGFQTASLWLCQRGKVFGSPAQWRLVSLTDSVIGSI